MFSYRDARLEDRLCPPPPRKDPLDDGSFGDPGINEAGGIGGVGGTRSPEDVEDDGVSVLAKVVAEDGGDVGSSNEMKCAPSSALNSSRVLDDGKFSGGAEDTGTGWLSDHGALSGGNGDGGTRGLRDGEGGTEGGFVAVADCGLICA